MYLLQQLHKQEIKGTFYIESLKAGTEIEFLRFSRIFLQS